MKKIFLTLLLTTSFFISQSQEIISSKPIKTFYKSGDQIIQSVSKGDGVIFMFQDERYSHIDEIISVNFKNKEKMLYFFDKVSEVQFAKKTERTVDLSVSMNDHVLNEKNVDIVRKGSKQFVVYIYVGKAYTIIPKTYLKRLLKKIRS